MTGSKSIARLLSPTLIIALLVNLAACGEPEPVEEDNVTPMEVVEAPVSVSPQPQIPGFGPVTIRAMGTTPKPAFGTVYPGDCDDSQPDDDVEVMTFSAPWKIVGSSSGGKGARYGTPVSRSFDFQKDPAIMEVQLRLDFGLEKSDLTAADLTDGLPKVADITFGTSTIGLFRVAETYNLRAGYAAIFPLVAHEGMPREAEFTNRYIATVQVISGGIPEFEGWSEAEIIKLFESMYAVRCLGEGLEQGWAALAPSLIFE